MNPCRVEFYSSLKRRGLLRLDAVYYRLYSRTSGSSFSKLGSGAPLQRHVETATASEIQFKIFWIANLIQLRTQIMVRLRFVLFQSNSRSLPFEVQKHHDGKALRVERKGISIYRQWAYRNFGIQSRQHPFYMVSFATYNRCVKRNLKQRLKKVQWLDSSIIPLFLYIPVKPQVFFEFLFLK